nr:hypothetical protein [Limosilactobacillus ingluviei]
MEQLWTKGKPNVDVSSAGVDDCFWYASSYHLQQQPKVIDFSALENRPLVTLASCEAVF